MSVFTQVKNYRSLVIFIFMVTSLVTGKVSFCQTQSNQQLDNSYEIYITKAITNTTILPNTHPIPGFAGRELIMTACRGEYEAASFVVRALGEIKGLTVTPTDLHNSQSAARPIIPASAVDIRVVKCWFGSGETNHYVNEGKFVLTPELLLKDDKLVKVDLQEKKNYLRTNILGKESYILISNPDNAGMLDIKPKDAQELQPVDIEPKSNKQFWVTVHLPENAAPGHYEGKINLGAVNAPASEIILRLNVLPFTLERPMLRYSIYYRGKLAPRSLEELAKEDKYKRGILNAEWKTSPQYYAEMQDLKAHGIEYPGIMEAWNQLTFRRELSLREKAGLPKGPLYVFGFCTGNPSTPDKLDALKSEARNWLKAAKEYGYEEVYFYGIDEAAGDQLKSQRPAWKAVKEEGGKIFAACYYGAFEAVGDLLDLALIARTLNPLEAQKYHGIGHQIFSYSNPFGNIRDPETYRRNYGLLLWKAGYDGSMVYAYQDSVGHIWNDFDDKYRDHAFTRPTINGVIDSRQWEGFREGIDDVRYLTTLLRAIRQAKARRPEAASTAQSWVDNLRLEEQSDLDAVRTQIISWILKLQG